MTTQGQPMDEALIRMRGVSIGYGRPLVRPIDLDLCRGEFWGVVGPNGAGKTTLAKTILGLVAPIAGKIETTEKGLRASYTPQRHRLNPQYPLSAFDVALMGSAALLPIGKRPAASHRRRVEEELDRLDMLALGKDRFRTLSGGQQQRVLLARALAADPDILVLDEPAEGMDLVGTADILGFLRTLNGERKMALLMISHHLDDVVSTVDHLCLINQYTGTFETGPVTAMVSSDKLTSLYGRRIETHACDGMQHVHVQDKRP
jgi:ABC-type Mn2+/Zn2+ transport system ATPase subunit